MNQHDNILVLDTLLANIHDSIKETFDNLSGDVDIRRDGYRVSDCLFLINIAGFVKNAILQDIQDHRRNAEEVVRIVNNPNVTIEKVEQDVNLGLYLSRWIEEFGSTILFWGGLDTQISQRLPRDEFEALMRLFHQDSQKHRDTLDSIRRLRPQHLNIPNPPPGGDFRTPYLSFFASDVYRNYHEATDRQAS